MERKVIGLQNLKNTCYINSIIQLLSSVKPLTEFLYNTDFYANTVQEIPE